MGQKVNPHGARVGVILDWSTKWYAGKKDFSNNLIEDYNIRKLIPLLIGRISEENKKVKGGAAAANKGIPTSLVTLIEKNPSAKQGGEGGEREMRRREVGSGAGVSRIDIQRSGAKMHIIVYTSKPGVVIGPGGHSVELLKNCLEKYTGRQVALDIMEIKNANTDAQLVAESIAEQLEKRISFRRAMKQALQRAMEHGAKGIKTSCSGRLGGADIARSEGYHEGSIPLQTLRANIDFGFAEAKTTYGRIGVKVWIYKGQVLPINGKKVLVGYTDMKDPRPFGRNDRRGNGRGPRGERRDRNDRPQRKEGGN